MMPRTAAAFVGFQRRATVLTVKADVVDGEAIETARDSLRIGIMLVAMKPQAVAIKPEGERTWKWWTGLSRSKLELGWYVYPDNDGNRGYRIMERTDSSQHGFYGYELTEAPKPTIPSEGASA